MSIEKQFISESELKFKREMELESLCQIVRESLEKMRWGIARKYEGKEVCIFDIEIPEVREKVEKQLEKYGQEVKTPWQTKGNIVVELGESTVPNVIKVEGDIPIVVTADGTTRFKKCEIVMRKFDTFDKGGLFLTEIHPHAIKDNSAIHLHIETVPHFNILDKDWEKKKGNFEKELKVFLRNVRECQEIFLGEREV